MKKSRLSKELWDRSEWIELTTLEKLIEQFGIPAFIKIDVEGFELQVLKGLKTAVTALSFEYTVPEQINKTIECVETVNAISGSYRYNYSIGEDMRFELDGFCDYDTFKSVVNSPAFINSGNGDVYVQLHQGNAVI